MTIQQVLPRKHTFSGYGRNPGEDWTPATCTWWMWLGYCFAIRWRISD